MGAIAFWLPDVVLNALRMEAILLFTFLPVLGLLAAKVMKAENDQIDWTDLVFIPAGLILAYILGKWLPTALAIALSVVLLSLVFSLVEPRKVSFKRLTD